VQQALQELGERLVRRRIRLSKKLAPDLPLLLVDAARVRDALASLLTSALESAALGGRIRVETRRAQGHVVIEISHDGARAAGGALEQLFVPFAARAQGATGLASAARIVREHGG